MAAPILSSTARINKCSIAAMLAIVCLAPVTLLAQSKASEDAEPPVVMELGGAAAYSLTESKASFGPALAFEATPIEDRLEVEAGVAGLFRRHATEWDTDFLFKKPWTLTKKVEFMVGAGPEWIHSRESGLPATNAFAIELEPEFMIWRSARHDLGWYIEPSYEYMFGKSSEQSIGLGAGIMIGIPFKK